MSMKAYLKAGSMSALAAAMALAALPTETVAQSRDSRWGDQRSGQRSQSSERSESRSDHRESRGDGRSLRGESFRPDRPQRQAPQGNLAQSRERAPMAQERSGADWNRSDRRSEVAQERSGPDWNRSDRRAEVAEERSGRDWNRSGGEGQPNRAEPTRTAHMRDVENPYVNNSRNRSYSDRDRNRTYSNRYRDGVGDDHRDVRHDGRSANYYGHGDGHDRYRDERYSGHHRDWDRRWRDNHQYDWYRYRDRHRDIYRIGRYYTPYYGYRYSRISIGFYLDSLFFGSRYWINDPWQYRLPPVYGPYRWVRYYDDVLLVSLYDGRVVDVIYNFFW